MTLKMAPTSNVLQQFMRATRVELLAAYAKSAGLEHNALMGAIREAFIHEFLEKAFPKKFVIGAGKIFDSKGGTSPQADVIVYDETMPVLHHGPRTAQYFAEGVLAHTEVKTSLTKDELWSALKKGSIVKSMPLAIEANMSFGNLRTSIPSFIIAYDGQTKETFKGHVTDFYATSLDTKRVDGIFVLQQGYAAVPNEAGYDFVDCAEDILLMAFLRLYEAFWKNWAGYPNFNDYVSNIRVPQF